MGKWLGESIAKLQGYKDRTEDLDRAQRAAAEGARQAAASQAAIAQELQRNSDRIAGLSPEVRKLLGDFDQLRTKGKTAADALAEVSKNLDFGDLTGINNAASLLGKLASDGKISAQRLRDAWAQALDGKDLVQFQTVARAVFTGTAGAQERARLA